MNYFEKLILDDVAKPPAERLLANLTTNSSRNVADIQAAIGSSSVVDAVVAFILKQVKTSSPLVLELEALALPTFEADLAKWLGTASADVPTAYAAALAFLSREIGYL